MHKYYNDAKKIYSLTKHEPLNYFSILSGIDFSGKTAMITGQLDFWDLEESASVINDSRMIIRFNLLLLPLSRDNIFIHLVTIVFLSFVGLYLIFISFEKYFHAHEMLLLTACFGVPSVMFWSSGIMKEGLLIFFTGLFTYHLFKKSTSIFIQTVMISIAFFGIFFSKFYVAIALIPSLIFLAVAKIFKDKSVVFMLLFSSTLTLSAAFFFNEILDYMPLKKLSKKQNDFINLSLGGIYLKNTVAPYDTIFTPQNNAVIFDNNNGVKMFARLKPGTVYHHWKNPGYADTLVAHDAKQAYQVLQILEPTGSAISLNRLMPNYLSVIRLLPCALINVFFRPFVNDVENLFSLFACIENIGIIVLCLTLVFNFKMPKKEIALIIIYSLMFVFTLYILVGLTTPVIGATVRYKVPVIPFLILSIFLLHKKSVLNKFKR